MRYSQYRHADERGNGHLWQSRYYSCPVEPDRLGALMRYVELNPVRAGLAREPDLYPWSSAAAHLHGGDPQGLLSLSDWRKMRWTPEEWRMILASGRDEAYIMIQDATFSGRPFGSDDFIGRLEAHVCRCLRRGIPGRPRKEFADAVHAGGAET